MTKFSREFVVLHQERQPNRLRLLTDEEAAKLSPVPIYCTFCNDAGTIPDDPIFVNNGHHYGIDYRSEVPCPKCGDA